MKILQDFLVFGVHEIEELIARLVEKKVIPEGTVDGVKDAEHAICALTHCCDVLKSHVDNAATGASTSV